MRFIRRSENLNHEQIERVSEDSGISRLLAEALLNRGLSGQEEIARFLHPALAHMHDPFLLPDMAAAVARIRQAMENREEVCIYGDYDADGVCAAAMLYSFLRKSGMDAMVYLPSRHDEGYGLNPDTVRRLAEKNITLLITVDNGIAAHEEIALCYALGMEVIVTDHHQCPDEIPACVAVINAHRPTSLYPFPELCGAGVTLKLIQALGGAVEEYLAAAALATVADIVPLRDENRVIVSCGLPYIEKHTGLRALMQVAGSTEIDSEALAFRLAPRINAAGRMGDANRALSLLLEGDAQRAHALALELNDENSRRQQEERRILNEAEAQLKQRNMASIEAILLYGEDWNSGVIGIVASKLVEKYYRPVLLFSLQEGVLTGSCRSIPGIDIYRCLQVHSGMLVRCGGHAQAAGLTIMLENFEPFRQAFEVYLRTHIESTAYTRTRQYEIETGFAALAPNVVEELQLLAPFGEGNPRPLFYTRDVLLEDSARIGGNGAHMRAIAVQEGKRLQLVAFGYGEMAAKWKTNLDILYTADMNEWMGNKRLQLQLQAADYAPFFSSKAHVSEVYDDFYDAFFYNVLYNDMHAPRAMHVAKGNADLEIARSAGDGAYGVLVLVATPAGAEALRDFLIAAGLRDRFRVSHRTIEDAGAEHTVLLAPELSKLEYSRFSQVYLYDFAALMEFICLPGDTEFSAIHLCDQGGGFLKPLMLNREAMGKYYSYFCKRLQGGARTADELINGRADKDSLLLTLLVFVELGFFQWNQNISSIVLSSKAARRDLMESTLYRKANS